VGQPGGEGGERGEGLEVLWCVIDVQMVDAERLMELLRRRRVHRRGGFCER
jgi:hypothetical protein